jgi:excisionase family DNA binding protein
MLKSKVAEEKQSAAPPIERMAYSIDEAAQAIGVSRISIYRLRQRGLLKFSDALRHRRIAKSQLEKFLISTAH